MSHVVSEKGVEVDQKKLAKIQEIEVPQYVSGALRLGFSGRYRFLRDFADNSAPLHVGMSWKKNSFCTEATGIAFEDLKNALVPPPVLTCLDF